jgi:hypothetical protein
MQKLQNNGPQLGLPAGPQTLQDYYALNHDQRKAYSQANPNGLQAIINAHNAILSNQGYGPGAATTGLLQGPPPSNTPVKSNLGPGSWIWGAHPVGAPWGK